MNQIFPFAAPHATSLNRERERGETPTPTLLHSLESSPSRSSCLCRRSSKRPQGCAAGCTYSSQGVSWGRRRRRCYLKTGPSGRCWCWAHRRTARHWPERGFCWVGTGLVLFWNRDRTGISIKDSPRFEAILQIQSMFVTAAGLIQGRTSSDLDLCTSQEITVTSFPAKGAPRHTVSSPELQGALSSKCYRETLTWSSLAEEGLQFQTSPVSSERPEAASLQSSQMPSWPLSLQEARGKHHLHPAGYKGGSSLLVVLLRLDPPLPSPSIPKK